MPHKPLLGAVLAALAACALAAVAAEQDEPDERTVLIEPVRKYKGPFAHHVRSMVRDANIPDGHKIRLTIIQAMNMNVGRFEDVVSVATVVDPNGVPDGLQRHYEPQLGLTREVEYEDGNRHGLERFYQRRWKNRQPRRIVPWVNDRVHGIVRTYYRDGKVASETPFVRGRQHGVSKAYDQDKRVIQVTPFRLGKRHGTEVIYWRDSRKVRRSVEYEDGKVHGWARQYYPDGTRKRDVQAWGGMWHGVEKLYSPKGELTATRYWVLDERVPKAEFDLRYKVPPVLPEKKPKKPKAAGASEAGKGPEAP
jgi:antitoxin component YwqK of YwqJK toxin-antitoxin module